MRPGPWLRLTALLGAAGTLLAVVSGSAGLGTAHRVLAALALPPLAAVVASAWVSYRRLLYPSVAALILFGLAAAVTAPGLHLALAALPFAASLVVVAQSCAARADVATVSGFAPRLRDADEAADHVAAPAHGALRDDRRRRRTASDLARRDDDARACARVRRCERLNHVLDADIDRLMGKRTRSRPVAAGRISPAYALEFGLALSALSFVLLAGVVNVLTALLALSGSSSTSSSTRSS